jgi:hypothetical protein
MTLPFHEGRRSRMTRKPRHRLANGPYTILAAYTEPQSHASGSRSAIGYRLRLDRGAAFDAGRSDQLIPWRSTKL